MGNTQQEVEEARRRQAAEVAEQQATQRDRQLQWERDNHPLYYRNLLAIFRFGRTGRENPTPYHNRAETILNLLIGQDVENERARILLGARRLDPTHENFGRFVTANNLNDYFINLYLKQLENPLENASL